MLDPFDFQLRTRLVFGAGTVERLGHIARELRFAKPLLVADPGLLRRATWNGPCGCCARPA